MYIYIYIYKYTTPLFCTTCLPSIFVEVRREQCTPRLDHAAGHLVTTQRKQRHSLKLGKKRRESSKRNNYIISPRVIIKTIIITRAPRCRFPSSQCCWHTRPVGAQHSSPEIPLDNMILGEVSRPRVCMRTHVVEKYVLHHTMS